MSKWKHNLAELHQLQVKGATAFYDAVLQALELLQAEGEKLKYVSKWVVALTDGADTVSFPEAVPKACEILRTTPKMNLALLTVSGKPKRGCFGLGNLKYVDVADMNVVNQYLDAARGGKYAGTVLHIDADNEGAIAAAFDSVSEAMALEGIAEVL